MSADLRSVQLHMYMYMQMTEYVHTYLYCNCIHVMYAHYLCTCYNSGSFLNMCINHCLCDSVQPQLNVGGGDVELVP